LDLCEHCVYGKQKRVRFLRVRKEKKSERLDIVHIYVWGPTWLSSLGVSHYYVAAIEASKDMILLQRFMEELGKKQENIRLYCDNESAINLANNSTFHLNTKNIQLRYHFI
jgi:hypothetical protein